MSITIQITKGRFAAIIVAIALAGSSVALAAAHPFTDVEDGKWYSDAVAWAYDNDITTGKTPTTFNGDDGVTRYEAVTFQQRYHDNVAQPALDAITDDIDALEDASPAAESRVAHTLSDSQLTLSDEQVLATASIQVDDPDGNDQFIVLIGSASVFSSTDQATTCSSTTLCNVGIRIWNDDAEENVGSSTGSVLRITSDNDAGSLTAITVVPAGQGTHNFSLRADLLNVEANRLSQTHATLTAITIPSGADGGQSLGLVALAAAAGGDSADFDG